MKTGANNSPSGLTVRSNNSQPAGVDHHRSFSLINISIWLVVRSLPQNDLGNPGFFHFVALPFSRTLEDAAGCSASGWQMVEGRESRTMQVL